MKKQQYAYELSIDYVILIKIFYFILYEYAKKVDRIKIPPEALSSERG